MNHSKEAIKRLFDELREIVDSSRNKERKKLWESYRRGIPGSIPITVDWSIPPSARLFGFDIGKFHTDAETNIRYTLEREVWHWTVDRS